LETSLKENPNDADTHHALGLVLDAEGNQTRAIDQYREAVKLRPGFPLANLSLGWALMKSSNPAEGLPYLKTAARSAEAPVREKAQSLLNQYYRR
jgi:cytochrome c-type biogenesis protein CcmH/NrfG